MIRLLPLVCVLSAGCQSTASGPRPVREVELSADVPPADPKKAHVTLKVMSRY